MKKITLVLLSFLLFVACSNKEEIVYSNPEDALRAYFTFLYTEDWKPMASLYGGNVNELTSMNPTIEKNNLPKHLKAYCTINGGQIVQIDKIQEKKDISPNEVEFTVTFIDKEGKPFKVRSTDKETTMFRYSVKKTNGSFKVVNLPPYQA